MNGINRRHFLQGLGAILGSSMMPAPLWSNPYSNRKFLFIHAQGGWDPLCVFAPQFDDSSIQMEAQAEPITLGNLRLVDGPGRSSVKAFFNQYASRSIVFNGVSTRSVNHETCEAVALTGSTSTDRSDWATHIAAAHAQTTTLPHLALSGTVFSGDLGVFVSRTEGSLQTLLSGEILEESEPYTEPLDTGASRIVQSFLRKRAQKITQKHPTHTLPAQLQEAQIRAHKLWKQRGKVSFNAEDGLVGQAREAIKAMSLNICQCATLSTEGDWDTHNDNSEQNQMFDDLFSQLSQVMNLLETTQDAQGVPMSKNTVVVVMSEMGRTPAYNLTGGRDHWPFTSFLMVGEGIHGGQVVGGYRDGFVGIGVDPYSLQLDYDRVGISAEEFGATLFMLAGLESQSILPHVTPLQGIVSS